MKPGYNFYDGTEDKEMFDKSINENPFKIFFHEKRQRKTLK